MTWLAACAACLLWTPLVHAQARRAAPARSPAPATAPAEYTPPEYQALIDRAVAEYGAHDFPEARALFAQAHEMFPNARTLRGLGMTEFELRNYAESIARLEQALASQVRPLEGTLRAQTEELLARARGFVTRYEIELKPPVQGATFVVDGVPVQLADGHVLTLGVGEHTLLVQAPSYREEKRALSVNGGTQLSLVIELQPQAAPALATSAQPLQPRDSIWSSPLLWTGVGAVVLGGVIVAVVASSSGGGGAKPIAGDIGGVVQTLGSR
ncbi:MAG TPA: tetratricopeptide repeat protein [Polyangiales bacterium]|nr:tetratricopeptide repeat protein [Polyangiales bacterium]